MSATPKKFGDFSFAEATVGFEQLTYTRNEDGGTFDVCIQIVSTTNNAPVNGIRTVLVSSDSSSIGEAGTVFGLHIAKHVYCTAGYFRGVYILLISKLLHFAELIFAKFNRKPHPHT